MERRHPGISAIVTALRKRYPLMTMPRIWKKAMTDWKDSQGVHTHKGGEIPACRVCGKQPIVEEVEASHNAMGYWRLSCSSQRCRQLWAARGVDYNAALAVWKDKQEVVSVAR